MTVNPDIVHSRKFFKLAKELGNWLKIDWSKLYAQDQSSIDELRKLIVEEFLTRKSTNLMKVCPNMVDYLLEYVGKEDWTAIALAVDNQNGMYHPLRLTKIVMGVER